MVEGEGALFASWEKDTAGSLRFSVRKRPIGVLDYVQAAIKDTTAVLAVAAVAGVFIENTEPLKTDAERSGTAVVARAT